MHTHTHSNLTRKDEHCAGFKQHRSAELTLSCTHVNPSQKEAGAAGISDKADFRTKNIIGEKERHLIITKGSILQKTSQSVRLIQPTTGLQNTQPTMEKDTAAVHHSLQHSVSWQNRSIKKLVRG